MKHITTTETGFPPLTSIQATPACIIAAGQTRPLKTCTSGWRKIAETNAQMLDGERWTGLVRSFAETVGFHLHHSIRDTPKVSVRVPENDGRYVACHAEKKLGLYFLAKQMKFANIGLDEALKGKLMEASLPLSRRQARIYLGHKPCKSCSDFLRCIRQHTGIIIKTVSGPVFSEHIRKRTFCSGNFNTKTLAKKTVVNQNNYDGDGSSSNDDEVKGKKNNKDDNDESQENEETVHDNEDEIEMADEMDPLEAVEAILETFPVGNVAHPHTPIIRPTGDVDDNNNFSDDKDEEEDNAQNDNDNDNDEVPLPAQYLPTSHVSVRSSPSPSISLASVVDSFVIDRRDRYPIYTSPTRCGGTAAPPSIWGERSKPPVTPCLEAPEFFSHEDMCEEAAGLSTQLANEQSYFFGTPSAPSERSVAMAANADAPAADALRVDPNPAHRQALQTPVNRPRTQALGSSDTHIMIDDGCEASPGAQSAVSPSFQVLLDRAERQNRARKHIQQQQQRLEVDPPRARSLAIPSDAAHIRRVSDARAVQHRAAFNPAQMVNGGPQTNRKRQGIDNAPYRPRQSLGQTPIVDLTDDNDTRPTQRVAPSYSQTRFGPSGSNAQKNSNTGIYVYGQSSGTTAATHGVTGRWFPTAVAARVTDPDIIELSSHTRSSSNSPSVFASPACQAPQPRPTPVTHLPQRSWPTAASRRRSIARPVRRNGRVNSSSSRGTHPFPDLSTFVCDTEAGWV
ncbi:hypothetical protein SBRCBS47491_008084 [Sporothrix bragantina]|uniref:Single-strand DNA deaminase toxin A-like C-terminal domain-containing protein n=1 Tax=Sporothrix bragantina TaxID=671064 RepID=A0ABP0CIG7_9PEZI